ncbi:MAG TPA: GNAT family N-acetyltransferase [Acidimicrobiia bacterium]|jgi:L-amino acid N-acyltransferase YncA|nr:GNAT family N-acetyltransferase [Acidimicrobiia bacterium]
MTTPACEPRDARETDIAAVQAIYAHHVLHGLGSFEHEPPPAEEMADRRRVIVDRGLPYLVAVGSDSGVLGFAYAAPYRARPAYRSTVEESVYVAPAALRRGVGRALLDEVVRRCVAAGARQMVAVIGDSGNRGSVALHAAAGFREVGVLRAVGWKHGRWVDTVIMQRELGEGDGAAPHTDVS